MAKNIEHTIARKLILSSNVAIEKKLETIKSIDNANQCMSDLEKIIFSVLYEKKSDACYTKELVSFIPRKIHLQCHH